MKDGEEGWKGWGNQAFCSRLDGGARRRRWRRPGEIGVKTEKEDRTLGN